MKKSIVLPLAALLLSFCACDSSMAADENLTTEESGATEYAEESGETEYAIEEAFGTDNVECIVKEIKWISPEEFDSISVRSEHSISSESSYTIPTELIFPDITDRFGNCGGLKSKLSDKYFLFAAFSLQNTGKEIVEHSLEPTGWGSYHVMPYGTVEAVYDDGYTFEFGDKELNGFTTTLAVLGDAVETAGGCLVPKAVFENEDKPLKLKVTLPNASGETEEFFVSIR